MAKLNLKALCKVLVNDAAHGNRGSGPPWRPGYAAAERILNRKLTNAERDTFKREWEAAVDRWYEEHSP